MTESVRVVLNKAGFDAILTGPEVTSDMQRRGRAVAAAAGDGFEASTVQLDFGGSPRTAVVVRAVSAKAKRAQARDRVLHKAIDAGRT